MTVLSTKKLLLHQKQMLLDNRFQVIDEDFINIQPKDFSVEKIYDSILFTSKNSVKNILPKKINLQNKICFCVGEKTKKIAQENGFIVQEYAHYASELIKIIKEKYNTTSFTFFCGNKRLPIFPDFFTQHNIKWNQITVYTTQLTPKKIKKTVNSILFFSPSAVASYCLKNSLKNIQCYCIGTTTAKALQNKTDAIIIADKPTIESTINKIIMATEANKTTK